MIHNRTFILALAGLLLSSAAASGERDEVILISPTFSPSPEPVALSATSVQLFDRRREQQHTPTLRETLNTTNEHFTKKFGVERRRFPRSGTRGR